MNEPVKQPETIAGVPPRPFPEEQTPERDAISEARSGGRRRRRRGNAPPGSPPAAQPTAQAPEAIRPAAPAIAPPPVAALVERRWPIIAGAAIAGMLLAWIITALQTPTYRASALAAVTPSAEALSPNELLRGVEVLEQRTIVATLAALASTGETLTQATADGVGSDYQIIAAVLPNTNLVRITVEGRDASRAAEIANRVPPLLANHARTMYRFYRVTTVSPATAPKSASAPRQGRAIAAGLLAGLLIGAAVVFAVQRLRPPAVRT